MKKLYTLFAALLIALTFTQPVSAQSPVVRAVLFYSPTCGHCQTIINEILPPLQAQYGEQLQILMIDATLDTGAELYVAARQALNVSQKGVPLLIVGSTALLGSRDIPNQFPGIIETGLTKGGIDWPAVPGLETAIQNQNLFILTPTPATLALQATPAATPGTPPQGTATPTAPFSSAPVEDDEVTQLERFGRNFAKDPTANSLAVIILGALVVSAVASLAMVFKSNGAYKVIQPSLLIPILCIVGLGIASYLWYIETTLSEAFCGPVGDCNAVQQSPYARLFGVIPVAAFGLAGYIGILAAWLVNRFGPESLKRLTLLAMWGMALFGILFTIYLTFLEPFVIGASCIWCLSSAVVIMLELWLATPGAKAALAIEEA